MYQPELGKFFTQDRFASKYFGLSPYSYVDNNPMLYVDVNGDSINVSQLISKNGKVNSEGLYVLFNMVSDLQDITGLNISVNGTGKLVTDGKAAKGGSAKAASYMNSLISDRDDIMVGNNNSKSTQGGGKGYVNLNSNQIDDNIASMNNAGLGELTFGYGMSFLHETIHTAIGTKIINPVATSTIKDNITPSDPRGPTVNKINEFRNELGLPERSQYNWATPAIGIAATMNWDNRGQNAITQTKMDLGEKIRRRFKAIFWKSK